MNKLAIVLVALAVLAGLAPQAAQAQSGRRVALGFGLGLHSWADDTFHQASPGFSIVDRIRWHEHARQGWALEPKATVDWSRADVRADDVSGSPRTGRLRSIPLLVGAGPAYRRGRVTFSPALLVGTSFNHYTADAGHPALHVHDAFVARPEAGLWYDLSSTLGLRASASYLVSHPRVDGADGVPVTGSGRWNMDHFTLTAGFAIGVD